jgi:DNA-directed RNA polymerase specialized sigma24 family protein
VKIPKGYNEQQILEIINRICKLLAPKYTFGIYDADDIKQEAFILALNALEGYKQQAPLEAFLYLHIKCRLKNLKRKKFSRASFVCNNCEEFDSDCDSCLKREHTELAKRNLSHPIDISAINPTNEASMMTKDATSEIDLDEILKLVNEKLPVNMREDYLKLKDGMYIEKSKRDLIEQTIKDIVEGHI